MSIVWMYLCLATPPGVAVAAGMSFGLVTGLIVFVVVAGLLPPVVQRTLR